MRRVLIAIAVLLMLSLSLSLGYIFTGMKWDHNPSYYISGWLDDYICEGASSAVRRAARTWSSIANFSFDYVGTAGYSVPLRDGINVVGSKWLNHFDPGVTMFWPPTGNLLVECDMVLNERLLWDANPADMCVAWAYDVESVAAHEFGHWLQLDDVYDDPEATMYYVIYWGETKKRTLSQDDIDGIRYIYGPSPKPPCKGGCCGKTPPKNRVDHPSEGGGCGNLFERGRVGRWASGNLSGLSGSSDEEAWLSVLGLVDVFGGVRWRVWA